MKHNNKKRRAITKIIRSQYGDQAKIEWLSDKQITVTISKFPPSCYINIDLQY